MSRPGKSDVHVDSAINALSVAIAMATQGVARKLFPIVPVLKSSDQFRIYTTADLKSTEMAVRARGTRAARGGFGASHSTYTTLEYAHGYAIPWETIREDDLAEIDQVALAALMEKAVLKEEALFMASFFTSSVWTGLGIGGGVDGSPGTKWSDAASTPISQLRTMAQGVHVGSGGGSRKNIKLLLPRTVMDALSDVSEVRDRVKYVSANTVDAGALAQILDIGEVLVAEGVYNSAAEGQTATLAYQADDAALMLYVPPAPSRLTPAAGYTFSSPVGWAGPDAGSLASAGAVAVRQYDEEPEAQTVYEGAFAIVQKQVMASAGVFAANVL